MGPRSIRARVTTIAVVVVAVVLVLMAVVVVVLQQRSLLDDLDGTLDRRAAAILAELDEGSPFADSGGDDRFAQLLAVDGSVLGSTENLGGRAVPVSIPVEADRSRLTSSDVPIEDDRYRVLIVRVATADGAAVLVVGENIDDIADAVRNLAVTFAVLIPVVVAALGVAVWWLVGRTLKPVEQIRSEVAEISLERLDRRVPDPDTGDEIDRLAATMNEMLDRLERSNDRLQRFVADASHELRSPLTRIRSTVEVDLAAAESDLETTCRGVLDETIGIQNLVDDLLFLARHDDPHALPRRRSVDLDVVVDAEVERLRQETGTTIDMSGVSAGLISGDPSQIARLVRNLLDNAARHMEDRVVVTLVQDGRVVRLTVDDDGPGVADDDRDRIFERFTRVDESRSTATGGTGLGLAIAHDIAIAHGGTIRCESAPTGGARFVVEIPALE